MNTTRYEASHHTVFSCFLLPSLSFGPNVLLGNLFSSRERPSCNKCCKSGFLSKSSSDGNVLKHVNRGFELQLLTEEDNLGIIYAAYFLMQRTNFIFPCTLLYMYRLVSRDIVTQNLVTCSINNKTHRIYIAYFLRHRNNFTFPCTFL